MKTLLLLILLLIPLTAIPAWGAEILNEDFEANTSGDPGNAATDFTEQAAGSGSNWSVTEGTSSTINANETSAIGSGGTLDGTPPSCWTDGDADEWLEVSVVDTESPNIYNTLDSFITGTYWLGIDFVWDSTTLSNEF